MEDDPLILASTRENLFHKDYVRIYYSSKILSCGLTTCSSNTNYVRIQRSKRNLLTSKILCLTVYIFFFFLNMGDKL